jgi:ribonuclease VapC
MIVIDSSVFVATIAQEPEAERLNRALGLAAGCLLSAGSYVECAIVAEARFDGRSTLNEWLRRRRVAIVPVDREMAEAAADAFRRFGKGRHPAKLNYGDCFAYALARTRALPLLYKGDDFARTNITSALV